MVNNLLNTAPDGILVVDAEGRILLANSAVQRLFGYSVSSLIGQPVEILMPEALREAHRAHRRQYSEIPRLRVMSDQADLFGQRLDGSIFPIDISLTPLTAGRDLHVIVIIHNASERRLAESAMRERDKLAEELSHTRKLEAIGRLAGGIAHDFNNLLTVIKGNAELLEASVSEQSDPRRMLADIQRAALRGSELTRQLLAFGRRQKLRPSVVDVNVVLSSIESILQRVIGEDVRIQVRPGSDLPKVRVDSGQIEQVMLNLAVNARDAMPTGGELSVETSVLVLTEPLRLREMPVVIAPNSYVRLVVRDGGSGMDQDTRDRAFEPFFTTKECGKGTGLGLSTVYGIIKQSSGYVWIESEIGKGTTVNILLPAVRLTAREGQLGGDVSSASAAGSVLLVEDDPSVRDLLKSVLVGAGYDVMLAADGREALKVVSEAGDRVDVIVTDVLMPHMNGPAMVRAAVEQHPHIKVLYVSGHPRDFLSAVDGSGEPHAFLSKPFENKALLERVAALIDTTPSYAGFVAPQGPPDVLTGGAAA